MLSIVIPAYNESARLATTLTELLARTADSDVEIIVVDDGSTDGTADLARQILSASAGSRVLELGENRGKGAAVRAGIQAATAEAVVFMDADLATDLGALDEVLDGLETADVVVGSRAVAGAVVHDGTRARAIMGRTFNRMVRAIARSDVHDTQCGFKAFRGPAARVLFGLSRIDGFAFDAEVLYYARALRLRVVEVPVVWTAVVGSSVRPVRDSIRTAFDLLRVVARNRPAGVRRRARSLGWSPEPAPDPRAVGLLSSGEGHTVHNGEST
jgi:glycosyltransferase involved in cell wall biosynthesis